MSGFVQVFTNLTLNENDRGIVRVISGRSHKPSVVTRGDVLFLNAGSAGPRRFKLPVTVAQLNIQPQTLCSEIVELL